jgi:hypothetical protein
MGHPEQKRIQDRSEAVATRPSKSESNTAAKLRPPASLTQDASLAQREEKSIDARAYSVKRRD